MLTRPCYRQTDRQTKVKVLNRPQNTHVCDGDTGVGVSGTPYGRSGTSSFRMVTLVSAEGAVTFARLVRVVKGDVLALPRMRSSVASNILARMSLTSKGH